TWRTDEHRNVPRALQAAVGDPGGVGPPVGSSAAVRHPVLLVGGVRTAREGSAPETLPGEPRTSPHQAAYSSLEGSSRPSGRGVRSSGCDSGNVVHLPWSAVSGRRPRFSGPRSVPGPRPAWGGGTS